MKRLYNSILDQDFDGPKMPSTDFPGARELLDILSSINWKTKSQPGKVMWSYKLIDGSNNANTTYARLERWVKGMMKRSKFKDCVPVEFEYSDPYSMDDDKSFNIEFFEPGTRWIITIETSWGEAIVSVYDMELNIPRSKPKGYIPQAVAEFIKWFIENECKNT